MPKWKAQKDSEGGGVERDLGWCEFVATDRYRDNHEEIFGSKCLVCKRRIAKGMKFCTYCNEHHTEPMMGGKNGG